MTEPDVMVGLPRELVERLTVEANRRDVSTCELVRAACEHWLALALVSQPAPHQSVTAWPCPNCGQWVGLNQIHSCMGWHSTRANTA